jgi:hypothetical protein
MPNRDHTRDPDRYGAADDDLNPVMVGDFSMLPSPIDPTRFS